MRFKAIAPETLRPLRSRFMSKVDQRGSCWVWTGALKDNGYGYFRISKALGMISAHRAAYLILVGEITKGMYVCHSCDIRSCVNPGHLWLGSQEANQRDMAAKGRVKSYVKTEPYRVRREQSGRFAPHKES